MSSSSAKRCVCPARRSVLLMRAECSANRVALVRTRSINEIKTDLREQRSFRSIASLQPVDRSIDRLAGRPVQRDGSTVGSPRKSTRRHRPIMSHHYFIFYASMYVFASRIFRQSLVAGSSLMRVITAMSDSRGISLI